MTKWQIIAKVMLVFMGLLIIKGVLGYASIFLSPRDPYLGLKGYAVFAILLIAVVLLALKFLIFANDNLASKIVGPGQILQEQAQRLWLVTALRIASVLMGLWLLVDANKVFARLLFLPFHIRELLNYCIWSENLAEVFKSNLTNIFINTCNYAKLAAGIYLVCGAPHLVRWHLVRAAGQLSANSDPA